VTSVDVLRLDARRGQGAALNAALTTHRASAYAFTDSDCVVAPDWITTIDKLAATDDGTDGGSRAALAPPPAPHPEGSLADPAGDRPDRALYEPRAAARRHRPARLPQRLAAGRRRRKAGP
jgi:hypothetical protein